MPLLFRKHQNNASSFCDSFRGAAQQQGNCITYVKRAASCIRSLHTDTAAAAIIFLGPGTRLLSLSSSDFYPARLSRMTIAAQNGKREIRGKVLVLLCP